MAHRPAWNDNDGMTLVEVLVSLAITFIIFLGLSSSGLLVLNENIKNELRDEAVGVADEEMMSARRAPFDNLATLPAAGVTRLVRNASRPYTVTRTVAALTGDNKQVTVDVTWNRVENGETRSYSHQASTILRRRP